MRMLRAGCMKDLVDRSEDWRNENANNEREDKRFSKSECPESMKRVRCLHAQDYAFTLLAKVFLNFSTLGAATNAQ